MKVSKYITAFILFGISTIFLVIISIGNFPNRLHGQNRFMLENSENVNFTKLGKLADEHNVLIYFMDIDSLSVNKTKYTFYMNVDNKEKILKEHLGLNKGILRDILGNKIYLKSSVLKTIDLNSKLKLRVHEGFVIGKDENCRSFIKDAQDEYDISIIYMPDSVGIEDIIIYIIFLVACIIMLIYCYIDASFEKKEIAIRVLNGDSSIYHYVICSLKDTAIFSFIIFMCIFFQTKFTQIPKGNRKVYYIFVFFIIAIWIINIHILHIEPKEMLYGHQLSSFILKIMFVFGNATAFVCFLTVFYSVLTASNISQYYPTIEFFRDHKNYCFVNFVVDPYYENKIFAGNDKANKYILDSYKNFFKEYENSLSTICINDLEAQIVDYKGKLNAIYCNNRAIDYLKSNIPEAKNIDVDKNDVSILFPDSYDTKELESISELLLGYFNSYEGYLPDDSNLQIIKYKSGKAIMSFSSDNKKIKFYDNAIILVASDTFKKKNVDKLNINHVFLQTGMIFDIKDKDVIAKITDEYPFELKITNAFDKFKNDFYVQVYFFVTSIAMTILVFILYISVLKTALELDYKVNSVELAIKKTLGYTIIQKNKKHFIGASIVFAIELIIAIIINNVILNMKYVIFLCPFITFFINCIIIYWFIFKIERKKISNILKGGAL